MLCAIFQQRLHALITSVILIITGLDQRFIDRQLLVQHGRTEALGTFDGGRFRLVAADNGNIAVPLLIQVLDSHLAGTGCYPAGPDCRHRADSDRCRRTGPGSFHAYTDPATALHVRPLPGSDRRSAFRITAGHMFALLQCSHWNPSGSGAEPRSESTSSMPFYDGGEILTDIRDHHADCVGRLYAEIWQPGSENNDISQQSP